MTFSAIKTKKTKKKKNVLYFNECSTTIVSNGLQLLSALLTMTDAVETTVKMGSVGLYFVHRTEEVIMIEPNTQTQMASKLKG